MAIHEKIIDCIIAARKDKALELIENWAEANNYADVTEKVLVPALDKFGKDFMTLNSISISQGYVAAKIAEATMIMVAQKTQQDPDKKPGKGPVVIGNIEDDFHSLGRKIVTLFLKTNGWQVKELGNDVPAEEFVDAAVDTGARIIGVSAMMFTTAMNILKVRQELDRRKLSGHIQLAVGGAVFQERPELVKEVGGDGTAKTAMTCSQLFDELWQRSLDHEQS